MARERLEQAVAEAEAALERLPSAPSDGGGASEDARTEAELAAARAENEVLRQANRQVSERLDQVILKLKAVLGS